MFLRWQRFEFGSSPSGLETPSRLRADLGENAFPHLDPRRKWIVIGVDGVPEQPNECVSFLIGQVGFHIQVDEGVNQCWRVRSSRQLRDVLGEGEHTGEEPVADLPALASEIPQRAGSAKTDKTPVINPCKVLREP
jgi:hypothetical protein